MQSRPEDANDTCTIIDGMASVQALENRGKSATFGKWCDKFQSYVLSHFSDKCTRVDIVFDRYLDNSIKGGTRTKRKGVKGKGIRRRLKAVTRKLETGTDLLPLMRIKQVWHIFFAQNCLKIASYSLVKNLFSAEASMTQRRHGVQSIETSPDSSPIRRKQILASFYMPGTLHCEEVSRSMYYRTTLMCSCCSWLTSLGSVMFCGCSRAPRGKSAMYLYTKSTSLKR